jgi:integrase/recombinase XerD
MAEITPLRRRMIEDMTVRKLSPATQQSYLNAVSKFSRYFGRSPDRLGLGDVHAFQVQLVATGISWPALNQIVCAVLLWRDARPGHRAGAHYLWYRSRAADASGPCRRSLRRFPTIGCLGA